MNFKNIASISTAAFMVGQGIRALKAREQYEDSLVTDSKVPFYIRYRLPQGFDKQSLEKLNLRNLFDDTGDVEIELEINPSSLEISCTPLINTTQTDGGWVEEYWGEQADTISASGRSPVGIITGTEEANKHIRTKNNVELIQRTDERIRSKYYQMILKLEHIFANQGFIYDEYGELIAEGITEIQFGDFLYRGIFISFSITETAESPFIWDYSFDFKVNKDNILNVRGVFR